MAVLGSKASSRHIFRFGLRSAVVGVELGWVLWLVVQLYVEFSSGLDDLEGSNRINYAVEVLKIGAEDYEFHNAQRLFAVRVILFGR